MNTRETMKGVTHKQASHLLHNKFVLILGDSIQRAVYKDLVLLLQTDNYLKVAQLKTKGEYSFEQDCLVEGGRMNQMTNGVEYREVRQYQSNHHLVRFYFLTRIYSRYMQSILDDLRRDLKPDIIIVNSCVWDISRYNPKWIDDYPENLHKFFIEITEILPKETLFIWNLTMPLGKKIIGGFFVPEIHHMANHLRHDVIEANFYSGTLADAYGLDVLDLHFHFRFSLQHRMADGIHWNALAHRRISSLLLQHAASAWGVALPCPPAATADLTDIDRQRQRAYDSYAKTVAVPNHLPWGVPAGPRIHNSHYMAGPGHRNSQVDRHMPFRLWRPPAPHYNRHWGVPVGTRSQVAWGANNNSGYPYPPPDNFFCHDTARYQEEEQQPSQLSEYKGHSHEFCDDSIPTDNPLTNGYISFEEAMPPSESQRARVGHRPCSPRRDALGQGLERDRFGDRLAPPRPDHYHPNAHRAPHWQENTYVMRNRHTKRHAAPYTVHRPRHHYHYHHHH